MPYYAQPAPVGMVSRPQVVIPVTGQPPFHAVTRPTIVHSTPVPTQVHWQPAQVQYQDVRPAAFQPVVHYGAVPQTSSGGPTQAAYGVPTGAGVHYVRGVKDTQVQGKEPQKYLQYSQVLDRVLTASGIPGKLQEFWNFQGPWKISEKELMFIIKYKTSGKKLLKL